MEVGGQGVFSVLNTDEAAMHDFMLISVNSMSIFLSGSKCSLRVHINYLSHYEKEIKLYCQYKPRK